MDEEQLNKNEITEDVKPENSEQGYVQTVGELTLSCETSARLPLFDNLRGLLVLGACIVNALSSVPAAPWYLVHAHSVGAFTVADVGVPFFLFILSVFYTKNYIKIKETQGKYIAFKKTIQRGANLVALGTIARFIEKFDGGFASAPFSYFMMYGCVTVLGLAVVGLKPEIRFGVGMGLLTIQHVLTNTVSFWENSMLVNNANEGGLLALIGWLGLLCLFISFGEMFAAKKKRILALSLPVYLLAILSVVLYFVVPDSAKLWFDFGKDRLSAFYFMLCYTAITAVYFVAMLTPLKKVCIPVVSYVGKKPVHFFLAGGVIGYILYVPFRDLIADSIWFVIIPVAIMLLLLCGTAFFVGKYTKKPKAIS
ncbi:MAG: hypothetical protein LBN25_03750 [Christensenellaceae bacterium]|jgi:hypothetical protein|nr:hypothetical protein [Christensenellaceae bacterium]